MKYFLDYDLNRKKHQVSYWDCVPLESAGPLMGPFSHTNITKDLNVSKYVLQRYQHKCDAARTWRKDMLGLKIVPGVSVNERQLKNTIWS